MAFYLKYRPQTVKELDLASVRDDLTKVLSKDAIPHSFLFAGPKGTGKTSAARILAKAVNCEKKKKDSIEPCGECEQCTSITKGKSIDVIELDAASHRGIDDIRALRDAVKLSPAHAKRKVYIIDEAHMLTTEASNALLKTLEEPPNHVIFILATTNPEKLIPTIRSRTTLIQFTKARLEEIISSLRKKLKGEGIKAEKEALELIAENADGSFRDADKLLEQLAQKDKELTRDLVAQKLQYFGVFDSKAFLQALAKKDSKAALDTMNKALNSGASTESLLDVTIKDLRETLLSMVRLDDGKEEDGFGRNEMIDLIHGLIKAKSEINDAPLEQIPLELAIVEWCERDSLSGGSSHGDGSKETSQKSNGKLNGKGSVLEELKAIKKDKKAYVLGDGEPISKDIWAQVLSEIRPINASTEALLRASRPLEMTGNKLKLGVYYRFHKEHLESLSHKSVLEQVCTKVLGIDTFVECLLTEPPTVSLKSEQTSETVIKQTTNSSKVDKLSQSSEETKQPGSTVLSNEEDEQIMQMAEEIFGE